MLRRGFIIGNGESRLGFDLNALRGHGLIYGCNALYRDFLPDALFAVDERMINEIKRVGLPPHVKFIYRTWEGTNYKLVSADGEAFDDPGYAAGPTALNVMCNSFKPSEVYLIGFDIYSKNGKVNNVYKNTDCYKVSDSKATYTGNWTTKLADIFSKNPGTTFYRVSDDEFNYDYRVPSWELLSNVYYINYEELNREISEGFND